MDSVLFWKTPYCSIRLRMNLIPARQNDMRDIAPLIRALWYLLAGVMPATIPMFFAAAFLVWYGKLFALAGFLGLVGAALIEPDREQPRVAWTIVLLLLCGLFPAGPVAYDAIRESQSLHNLTGLDATFIGPSLCVLTYLAESIRATMLGRQANNSPSSTRTQ